MTQSADVSVVIPVRNGERFICDAIDSVLAQSGFTLEVIVVDNGSTDRTRETVERRFGTRVTLVTDMNCGAANARNTGGGLATGGYLAFLDADDVWLPGKLERQIAAWNSQPEADLVFCWCQEFHSTELTPADRSRYICRPDPYPALSPSSYLSRLETFRKAGPFPNVPCGEFIAWYGLARETGLRTFTLPEVLFRRRIHSDNMTRLHSQTIGYARAAKWLLDQRRRKSGVSPS